MKYLFTLFFILITFEAISQSEYVAPTDSIVLNKIANWQDMKFGLLMHWGPYSQWGVVESWSICPEDEDWTQRQGPYSKNYFDYVKAYENLQATFNPIQFDPDKWVKAAKDAGMKYMIFTTKHHDGFCMFDTKETDYKITDPKTPFSSNAKSNVTKEIFNSFRKAGFWVGAYFSKPDWHSKNYWWPYFPPKNRNVNYDPAKYPERWNAFKQYTYNQIKELMSGYGKVDILWLDGGWVRPSTPDDNATEEQHNKIVDQNIDMKRIAAMARGYQPDMLIVDRTVTGEFENYTTPEQQVPEKPLSYPWETCMTMGNSWSYVPNDKYKSAHELIQLLVKIVSRGGNFLLNIGPGPNGDWDPVAYSRLQEIGAWMKINSEAIYNSKPIEPYSTGHIYYTRSKDAKNTYAFYLSDSNAIVLPSSLTLKNIIARPGDKISLLGSAATLKWKIKDGNTIIAIPAMVAKKTASDHVAVFRIKER